MVVEVLPVRESELAVITPKATTQIGGGVLLQVGFVEIIFVVQMATLNTRHLWLLSLHPNEKKKE